MKYYVKPDWMVTAVSALGLVALFYVFRLLLIPEISQLWRLGLGIPLLLIFCYLICNIPLYSYETETEIGVKKLIGKLVFSKDKVSVTPLEYADMSGMVRIFGSGGLFGYIGWFSTRTLGRFYLLTLTTKNGLQLIKTEKRKYVIYLPVSGRQH